MRSSTSNYAKALIFLAVANSAINASGPQTDAAVEFALDLSCHSLAPAAVRPELVQDQSSLLWICSRPLALQRQCKAEAVSAGQAWAVFARSPLESVKFQV